MHLLQQPYLVLQKTLEIRISMIKLNTLKLYFEAFWPKWVLTRINWLTHRQEKSAAKTYFKPLQPLKVFSQENHSVHLVWLQGWAQAGDYITTCTENPLWRGSCGWNEKIFPCLVGEPLVEILGHLPPLQRVRLSVGGRTVAQKLWPCPGPVAQQRIFELCLQWPAWRSCPGLRFPKVSLG